MAFFITPPLALSINCYIIKVQIGFLETLTIIFLVCVSISPNKKIMKGYI